jgi:hypothetical protein
VSAETLRRAAALMRERAEAAADGPWAAVVLGSEGYAVLGDRPAEDRRLSRLRVARLGWEDWDTDKSDAEHIASWHPAVALAVADLLDNEANAMDRADGFARDYAHVQTASYNDARRRLLTDLARAYLGEAS